MPPGVAPKVRKGDVRAAALALLAEGPRNGYQIIQEIERAQPRDLAAQPRLGLSGAAAAGGRGAGTRRGGRRTPLYRLTDHGRAHVADNREALAEPWAEVADSVTEEMVDLRSLFGQVGMALRPGAEAGTRPARRRAADPGRDTPLAVPLLAEDPEEDE